MSRERIKGLVSRAIRLSAEDGKITGFGTHEKTIDRKSTRLNSSHMSESRMPSSA